MNEFFMADSKKRMITTLIDPRLYAEVKHYCSKCGITIRQFTESAFQEGLDTEIDPGEDRTAKRRRLIKLVEKLRDIVAELENEI